MAPLKVPACVHKGVEAGSVVAVEVFSATAAGLIYSVVPEFPARSSGPSVGQSCCSSGTISATHRYGVLLYRCSWAAAILAVENTPRRNGPRWSGMRTTTAAVLGLVTRKRALKGAFCGRIAYRFAVNRPAAAGAEALVLNTVPRGLPAQHGGFLRVVAVGKSYPSLGREAKAV